MLRLCAGVTGPPKGTAHFPVAMAGQLHIYSIYACEKLDEAKSYEVAVRGIP